MDYHELLFSPRFFEFMLKIDGTIAEEAARNGCFFCGGPLHRANFNRSGHGLPPGCSDDCRLRFSFCCGKKGCRHRLTPQSVRFLRRRVFVALSLVLMPILSQGATSSRIRMIRNRINVSRQTLDQWRRWWKEDFLCSRFWQEGSGQHFSVNVGELPQSLIESFENTPVHSKTLVSLLRFLAPFGS